MTRRATLRSVSEEGQAGPGGGLLEPPGDLAESRVWWGEVVAAWSLAPDELALLHQAC